MPGRVYARVEFCVIVPARGFAFMTTIALAPVSSLRIVDGMKGDSKCSYVFAQV